MLRRLTCTLILTLVAVVSFAQERISDVIYAKRGGVALTMDVFKPAKPTGAAVIWIISGGWMSLHENINPLLAKPLTDKGFTVFEVVHGSQPRYVIPEIVDQIQRSVRFIRTNATTYGIDPNRIGITGGSAGGHLSLMVAGLAGAGNPDARDPIDRASAAVNAVVAFYPPVDFTNFGGEATSALKDPKLAIFVPAFGLGKDPTPEKIVEVAKATSPILLVTSKFPPTLLIHGDRDPLVPIQQSMSFDAALAKAGVDHKFITVPGGGHDGNTVLKTYSDLIAWFEAKLK